MVKLVNYRRSCRRFKDKNVEPEIIDKIIKAMENVPTDGNSMSIHYTIIDDKDIAKKIEDLAYEKMEQVASKGKFASVNKTYYEKMKKRAKIVRKGDLLFCHAPHLFIAHKRAVGRGLKILKMNVLLQTHILNFWQMHLV